jgi:hypothetical protein
LPFLFFSVWMLLVSFPLLSGKPIRPINFFGSPIKLAEVPFSNLISKSIWGKTHTRESCRFNMYLPKFIYGFCGFNIGFIVNSKLESATIGGGCFRYLSIGLCKTGPNFPSKSKLLHKISRQRILSQLQVIGTKGAGMFRCIINFSAFIFNVQLIELFDNNLLFLKLVS